MACECVGRVRGTACLLGDRISSCAARVTSSRLGLVAPSGVPCGGVEGWGAATAPVPLTLLALLLLLPVDAALPNRACVSLSGNDPITLADVALRAGDDWRAGDV